MKGAAQAERPNILWLVWEDIGPHFHCCGDEYSTTPNPDRLAEMGCVYDNCWASAPVCVPARTAIISGVCPTASGAEHMRSMTRLPAGWKMFPGYLREAGYYCVNNGKEDYNLEKPEGTWDVSWELGAETAAGAGRGLRAAGAVTPSPALGGGGFQMPPIPGACPAGEAAGQTSARRGETASGKRWRLAGLAGQEGRGRNRETGNARNVGQLRTPGAAMPSTKCGKAVGGKGIGSPSETKGISRSRDTGKSVDSKWAAQNH